MKAKSGFILRNVAGEHILLPTGDNIGKFSGTVILNDVSAFIWEKLAVSTTKDEILAAILNEFEVDVDKATRDLEKVIDQFNEYELIEN